MVAATTGSTTSRPWTTPTSIPRGLFASTPFAEDLRSIRFLPKTPVEATGLPDHAYDLAMSQFGIEYADPESTVAEVGRVLKTRDAVFAAMIHHDDSAIVRQARDGMAQILACEGSGLHAALGDLLGRLDELAAQGGDAADDERAKALRTAINRILAGLNQRGRQYGDPGQIVYYVENSMATFNPQVSGGMSLAERRAMLRHVAAESAAYKERMRDLISAALDDAAIERLAGQLRSAGFRNRRQRSIRLRGRALLPRADRYSLTRIAPTHRIPRPSGATLRRIRVGASPSGKAPGFDPGIRRFESCRPSQLCQVPGGNVEKT